MPLRGSTCHFGAAAGQLRYPSRDPDVSVQPTFAQASLLPLAFNLLWTQALNAAKCGELTHFAMLHDDVCPDPGWLDVLLSELEWREADIVSAVVPMKDGRGLTSTALDVTGDEWNPYRLTLAEAFDREETFTHPAILLNTGCWVCRLDRPWCRKVWFRQCDRTREEPDGNLSAQTASEDWNFSRDVRACGGTRLYATRKVRLDHERAEFTNRHPWGMWTRDETHPIEVAAEVALSVQPGRTEAA